MEREFHAVTMDAAFGNGRTPMDELRAASDAYCDFHLRNPGYFRIIALRTLDVPPGDMVAEFERRIADKVEALVGDIADVLRRADAAGELHCPDPVRTPLGNATGNSLRLPQTHQSRATVRSAARDW